MGPTTGGGKRGSLASVENLGWFVEFKRKAIFAWFITIKITIPEGMYGLTEGANYKGRGEGIRGNLSVLVLQKL